MTQNSEAIDRAVKLLRTEEFYSHDQNVIDAQVRLLRVLANLLWHEEVNHKSVLPSGVRTEVYNIVSIILAKEATFRAVDEFLEDPSSGVVRIRPKGETNEAR